MQAVAHFKSNLCHFSTKLWNIHILKFHIENEEQQVVFLAREMKKRNSEFRFLKIIQFEIPRKRFLHCLPTNTYIIWAIHKEKKVEFMRAIATIVVICLFEVVTWNYALNHWFSCRKKYKREFICLVLWSSEIQSIWISNKKNGFSKNNGSDHFVSWEWKNENELQ